MAWRARESEPVWKCLDSRSFANRERPRLQRMDVPVAIVAYIGRNSPTQLVAEETLVLICEDVVPITLKVWRKLLVRSTLGQKVEGLQVIRPDRPSDVVKYLVRLIIWDTTPEATLKLSSRAVI